MKTLAHPAARVEILERLQRVHPDSRRKWGKMTSHQMICHLSDAFRVVIDDKPATFRATPWQQAVVKRVALYLPLPWPKGLKAPPEVDQQIAGTKPDVFAQDMRTLAQLIEQFTDGQRSFEARVHPILGKLTEQEWMRWAYLHVDHHLRQFGA
jgi:hypothetical protein